MSFNTMIGAVLATDQKPQITCNLWVKIPVPSLILWRISLPFF